VYNEAIPMNMKPEDFKKDEIKVLEKIYLQQVIAGGISPSVAELMNGNDLTDKLDEPDKLPETLGVLEEKNILTRFSRYAFLEPMSDDDEPSYQNEVFIKGGHIYQMGSKNIQDFIGSPIEVYGIKSELLKDIQKLIGDWDEMDMLKDAAFKSESRRY